MASDGRKRRSFLPAPRKSSGVSPTSPQSSGNATFPLQPQQHHHPHLLPAHHQQRSEQHQQQNQQQQHYYQQQLYQQSQPSHSHAQYQPQYSLRQHHYAQQHPQPQPSSSRASLTSQHDDGHEAKRSPSGSPHKRSSSGSPHPDFGQGIRVGSRIKIGGIKHGIVRYVGTIHLAPGIFCGIELADADGTHDGEVNGHRYFTCQPKHGIFAPKNKVCLDSAYLARNRLSSDSDPCYSSNESLAERSNQALRKYAEGELEAVDCSKISPTGGGDTGPVHSEASRGSSFSGGHRSRQKKANLNTTYDLDDSRGSPRHSGDYDDLPDPDSILNSKRQRSVLPRPKSSLPSPTSSAGQSRVPTHSNYLVKPSETVICPEDQLPRQDKRQSEYNANRTQTIHSFDPGTVGYSCENSFSLDKQHRRSGSSRSEDSEEDNAPRNRLSSGVKNQLRGDGRQYLNFTFDKGLRDSFDYEESGSDSGSKDNTYTQYQTPDNRIRPIVSSDSLLLEDTSSHSIISTDVLVDNSLTNSQPLDDLFHSKKHRRSGHRRTSTPVESLSRHSHVLKSWSYVADQGYYHTRREGSPDVITSDLPVNSDDLHSSANVIQSISDDDFRRNNYGAVIEESGWHKQGQGQMLIEGGYSNNVVVDGDGASATGLSFPPPIETHSNTNNLSSASKHAETDLPPTRPVSSESYTVFKGVEGELESNAASQPASVAASRSYTVAAAKVEDSANSGKVRRSSTSSSANGGDSSSSGADPKTESSEEGKGEQVDDSSSGVSPEISQTLEWDYGQDFDGKIPLHSSENTMSGSASTGTSESLSDVHSDVIESEPPSGATEDSDQFEVPENDFENIDSLEDFPIFGKDPKANIMTDSGISDRDFEFNMAKSSTSTICGNNSSDECSREDDTSLATTKAVGSDSSQETIAAELIADTPVSVEEKELPGENELEDPSHVDSAGDGYSNSPGSVVSVEEVTTICEKVDRKTIGVESDPTQTSSLSVGFDDIESRNGDRKERPISLLSTASADTGYAPDTDSEIGTLTTNTPSEWVDKHGMTHPTSYAPLDDVSSEGSPVDTDEFLKMECLALSKALRHQHSSQSTTSNVSDADDFQEGDIGTDVSKTDTGKPQPSLPVVENISEETEITDDTEDDRIEADQVLGPPGSSGSSHPSTREATPPKISPETGDTEGDTVSVTNQVDEELAKAVNEADAEDESVTISKDNSGKSIESEAQGRKLRNRKPLVMTKKKMEIIDHKLPNIKVASKLADYIKAPTPSKPKEEKNIEENKISKNIKNISKKRLSVPNVKSSDNRHRASSIEKGENENNDEENSENNKNRKKSEKIEKPKPIIKRTTPKSKWGNIMSQIEASKDTIKPKPKSEIKSTLATYLSTPIPPAPGSTDVIVNTLNGDGNPPPPPRKEFKSRIKPLPPPPPKIDLSKVKSKLSVPTAASASKRVAKRESSPAAKGTHSSRASRDSSPAAGPVTRSQAAKMGRDRASEGNIVLVRQPLNSTTTNSVRSSRTDLSCNSVDDSMADEGTSSKATSVTGNSIQKDRRHSTNSVKSSHSEKSKLRNGDVETTRRTRASAKNARPSNSPARMQTRTIEIRLDSSPAGSSRRSSDSPTPIIVKAVTKPRPHSQIEIGKQLAPVSNGQQKPSLAMSKGRNSVNANASQRSKLVNGATKPPIPATATTTSSTNKRSINTTGQSKTAKEVVRLESLCEARTKELTHTKMQLKATSQGFDAMAVLLKYCCTELDAFECPQLANKLEKAQKQLTDCLAEIGELTTQKEKLTEDLTQVTKDKEEEIKRAEEAIARTLSEKEEHERQQKELDTTHNAALTAQRDELTIKHEKQTKSMKQLQEDELRHMQSSFERKISALRNDGKLELSTLRLSHLEQIEALRAKHDSQMEDLHKQHRNKLEDITHRFETIKVTLSEKVESLRGECDDLRVRARTSEEALQKDADVKVQMAIMPYLNLPKEIESLKTVVEMRNEEVQKLRNRNMDLEKQLEEIPIAREKIISLQQKVENLEAIINIKTDHEKQMHEKCQVLMRKYDRESRANKRLSMDYEQVMWRMSQSEYGSNESLTKRQLSRSPPRSETTSPDARRRHLSPNSKSEVTMRVKKRTSNSESDGERKLRSRSATFVLEKDEGKDVSDSTQSTPRRSKQKQETKAENGDENGEYRMCRSAGAELITAALGGSKQAWSVTLTDSLNDDLLDEGIDSMPMGSTGEMAVSYARSLSGVSDSGVYDSLTRSDMLNSSIFSNDSEWLASTNVSMTLDSTTEEDADPFISHGNKVTNSDTVLDMTRVQDDNNVQSETSSFSSSAASADATVIEKDLPQDVTSCEFQLTLPGVNEDDVFTGKEIISKDISDAFTDRTIVGDVSTSCDVDVSFSHNGSAISSSQQSQPP